MHLLLEHKNLPTLQQTYSGWADLKAYSNSSSIIIKKLNSINKLDQYSRPVSEIHSLKKDIQLKNVSFKYHESSPLVLKDINLIIKKGEKIGILGKSGSGKTTLVDIIMGLLPPSSGKVLVDGINIYDYKNKNFLRAWRNSISHVPQSIFLLNNSIEQNISLHLQFLRLILNLLFQLLKKLNYMIMFLLYLCNIKL